jgi:hypothetical protein
VSPRDEDEVWRDIVENYGDVPSVEEVEPQVEPPPVVRRPEPAVEPEPWNPVSWEDEGRFVPPPPPPVPLAEPRRLLAWLGLFLSPTLLLVALIFGWVMPGWLSTLLVLWFVLGFGYLVATMTKGPRDPGDDGARI